MKVAAHKIWKRRNYIIKLPTDGQYKLVNEIIVISVISYNSQRKVSFHIARVTKVVGDNTKISPLWSK